MKTLYCVVNWLTGCNLGQHSKKTHSSKRQAPAPSRNQNTGTVTASYHIMETREMDMGIETEHERETKGHIVAEESRIRQLTEKVTNVYENKIKHCTVELSILWDRVNDK